MAPISDMLQISQRTYLISMLVLLGVCVVSVVARLYIRIRVQKQFSLDDGFLLFGICCLISSVGIQCSFMDNMYVLESVNMGRTNVQIPSDFVQRMFDYHKMLTVSLILSWCTIASVKFSFLFLFRNLIHRMPYLIMYWWVVLVFNVVVSVYGGSVYILICPYFYSAKTLQCAQRSNLAQSWRYSMAQNVLDIVSDLLILYIPVRLIWQIRIRWSQKAALTFSLCLTIVIVAFTIVRTVGLYIEDKANTVWGAYWQMMSAEVGVIMTAITAFRAFFVARSNEKGQRPPGVWHQWSSRSKQLLRRLLTPSTWRSRRSSQASSGGESHDHMVEFPSIPGGTMTGVRTFIDRQGRTVHASQMMRSEMFEEKADDDPWPLPTHV